MGEWGGEVGSGQLAVGSRQSAVAASDYSCSDPNSLKHETPSILEEVSWKYLQKQFTLLSIQTAYCQLLTANWLLPTSAQKVPVLCYRLL